MKNITVLVSGGGTNLEAILKAIKNGEITNAKVSCVISSNPSAYALKRAENYGIRTQILDKNSFKSKDEFNSALLNMLTNENPDLIVLAGFMCILSDEIVKRFENKIINVHPSLIPSFCGDGFYGLRVHQAAIDKGVKITGATVHFVNEITDGGAIIMQKAVNVEFNDTKESLQKRVMEEAEWIILPKAIDLFCNDKLEIVNNKVMIKE